jgi:phosphopantothenoylcysteine decarboxylase/phosphopantothenate--cysteine ligase
VACATTAADLAHEVRSRSAGMDVVVMAAAVADFRPVAPAGRKMKKRDGLPRIDLEPTEDVLAAVCADRHPGQVIVGFAAETDDVVANARAKLESKGADVVVANDVAGPDTGFAGLTNAVTILTRGGGEIDVPLGTKRAVARAVLDTVAALVERP